MMNNKVILYFILFCLNSLNIFAFTICGEITYCNDKSYLYRFCNSNGDIIEECTNDPNGSTLGTPLKTDLPICLIFEQNDSFNSVYLESETGFMPTPVFEKRFFEEDMIKALDDWNCICNSTGDCGCTYRIRFSNNKNDFINPQDGLNLSGSAAASTNITRIGCKVDCNKSFSDYDYSIIINNTEIFTGAPIESNLKRRYFINQHIIDDDPTILERIPAGCKVYNLRDIILHEIGHLLGFLHQSQIYTNKEYLSCPPIQIISSQNSIMDETFKMVNSSFFGLQVDDICMFKKLYCPDLVPVNDNVTNYINVTFPNPALEYIDIIVYSESTIQIVDIFGRNIQINKNKISDNNVIRIDVSHLPVGLYFVKIGNRVEKFVKM